MIKKKVAIVIVNWNGKHLLKNCLDSVFAQTYRNFDVYLVDNGSEDGSSSFIRTNYPRVKLIELSENTGFTGGNNVAFHEALKDREAKYVVAINNDTKAENDFLEQLIITAEKETKIGSVAPKMKFFYESELIDSVGILIHKDGGGLSRGIKEKDKGQYDREEEVFGPCGGAVLFKRELLEDVRHSEKEYFDNIFFAYYEDLDLAWRMRLRGWKTVSSPRAIIHHIHSATAISHSPFKAFHVNRNRFFVIIKNFPFGMMIWSLLVLTPIRYLRLLNSARIKKGPSYKLQEKVGKLEPVKIVLKGWFDVLKNLPEMLRKRKEIQSRKKVTNKDIKKWFEKYSANLEDMIYK